MPPRRRSASGYRGVRQRPNGGFYAEIRSGDLWLSLGTYDTAHEAARAFDAAAWRLGRPRLQMNFPDVRTLQQALDLAPPPRLNSAQDHAEHSALQRRLLVAQEDEWVMAEWRRRHPEDVAYEQEYWERRREEDTRRLLLFKCNLFIKKIVRAAFLGTAGAARVRCATRKTRRPARGELVF
ncbi:Protein TRANSPARENT TESTA 12 [Hordeum vulgare]|nr:Protein TRANSPARENT TESTA 12 [Hordeum vulgare]